MGLRHFPRLQNLSWSYFSRESLPCAAEITKCWLFSDQGGHAIVTWVENAFLINDAVPVAPQVNWEQNKPKYGTCPRIRAPCSLYHSCSILKKTTW